LDSEHILKEINMILRQSGLPQSNNTLYRMEAQNKLIVDTSPQNGSEGNLICEEK
jgi:hypothetical protein